MNIKRYCSYLLVLLFGCIAFNSYAEPTYIEDVTYYHNNHLGSPIAATDKDGNVKWEEHYAPYGERVSNEDSEQDGLWFAGKQEESDVGLSYFGSRWYDPAVGRFVSPDPAGLALTNLHSYNRYIYAYNNPYKFTDPDGELPFLVPVAIFVAKEVAAEVASHYSGGLTDFLSVRKVAMKSGRFVTDKLAEGIIEGNKGFVTKGAGKPDFIVSPKGTTMPTNKDFNLVDSNKKGGDWFQIHNKHTDAKVNGSPHTHYPKQHGGSRTREIKRTDGGDLDRADSALRNGTMRERRNRGDKGG